MNRPKKDASFNVRVDGQVKKWLERCASVKRGSVSEVVRDLVVEKYNAIHGVKDDLCRNGKHCDPLGRPADAIPQSRIEYVPSGKRA